MRPRVDLPQPELADQANHFAGVHRQADVVDSPDQRLAQAGAE